MNMPTDKKLTLDLVADPTLHRMGLKVSPDGLDVAIISRVSDNSLIYRHFDFAPGADFIKALEETVYDNPLLTADFGKVDVAVDTRRFYVADTADTTDDIVSAHIAALYPADRADMPSLKPMVNIVENDRTAIVCAIETDLLRFLRRTFNNPGIVHRMAVLARYFGLRNRLGNSGKIHVLLGETSTDIIAFGHRGLMLANTYDTRSANDAVYYTLAVAKYLGYDNDADRVLVGGKRALRDEFVTQLRNFVAFAMPEIFPSALLSLGDRAMDVPFELLAVALCE